MKFDAVCTVGNKIASLQNNEIKYIRFGAIEALTFNLLMVKIHEHVTMDTRITLQHKH